MFHGCRRAAERAPGRETRLEYVRKAFVAKGVCSQTLAKYKGFLRFGTPWGPKLVYNDGFCVLFVPRRLQKRSPEGHEHKTLVNSDRIWGVFLLSFSCPLRFLVKEL